MSSILKALKKLEDEKAARRAGIDIAKGIMKNVPVRPAKRSWLLPVSVSAAAGCAALLTFVLMKGVQEQSREPGRSEASRTISVAREASDQKSEIEPGIAPKKPKGADLSIPGVLRPVMRTVEKEPAKNPIQTKNSVSGSLQIPVETKTSDEDRRPRIDPQVLGKNDAGAAQQPVSAKLPLLRLSGIAWDKDGSERFAVVNGVSVGEGMTVSGAVVEKIFHDKVRFSFENKFFDLAVGNEMR